MSADAETSDRVVVADIGNTSTSLGLWRRDRVQRVRHLETAIRKPGRIADELRDLTGRSRLVAAAVSSVVPAVNRMWAASLRKAGVTKMLWVTHEMKLGVRLSYPHPETIGADRLANACGAVARYGAPVIVADFGTALTFDIISRSRCYIGGIIAPGLPLMFSYLAEKTALLPHIEPAPVTRWVGKSTEEAMRIGARYGYRGMVREILEHVKVQVGEDELTVCSTGGYAKWVLRGIGEKIRFDPDLTLYGLGMIWELNGHR